MIQTVKLSSKGQVVIPERIRKSLDIKEGSRLVFIEKDGRLIVEKEDDFMNELEERAWWKMAEQSLAKLWDNKEDEVWDTYDKERST